MIKQKDMRAEQARSDRRQDAESRQRHDGDAPLPQLLSLKFKSGGDNHIVCREWDGVEEGDVDLLVAMDPQLQKQLVGTGYTYSDFQNRTRDLDGRVEKIEPQFSESLPVFAMYVRGTTGVVVGEDEEAVDVILQMVVPSHHWAKAC